MTPWGWDQEKLAQFKSNQEGCTLNYILHMKQTMTVHSMQAPTSTVSQLTTSAAQTVQYTDTEYTHTRHDLISPGKTTVYALIFAGLNFWGSPVFAIFTFLFSQITDFRNFHLCSFLPASDTHVEKPSQIWDIPPFGDQKRMNGHPPVVDLYTNAKKRPSNYTHVDLQMFS